MYNSRITPRKQPSNRANTGKQKNKSCHQITYLLNSAVLLHSITGLWTLNRTVEDFGSSNSTDGHLSIFYISCETVTNVL